MLACRFNRQFVVTWRSYIGRYSILVSCGPSESATSMLLYFGAESLSLRSAWRLGCLSQECLDMSFMTAGLAKFRPVKIRSSVVILGLLLRSSYTRPSRLWE